MSAATDTGNAAPSPLARLMATPRIVLCCGPGGVGKTTTAAAIGLGIATSGRRCAVVTIDPAKRLANALGLEGLTNQPARIPLANDTGELWALMLDTKATFDDLVREHAPTPTQAERILDNPFYRNISGSLSGTQEYMATEKLYELAHAPKDADGNSLPPFDCIVVDTPPSRSALEFITAPARLTRFLDNRVFRALTAPARGGLRVVGFATQAVLRSIGKVVGGEVIADAIAFFQAFDGMEEGFRARAQAVLAMLRDERTVWVVITAPRAESVDESLRFARELAAEGITIDAVVANRVQPRFSPLPPIDTPGPLSPAVMRAHAADRRGAGHDDVLRPLTDGLPSAAQIRVPMQPSDVHDLAGLDAIRKALFMPVPTATGDVPAPTGSRGTRRRR